jgi:hypothetical protein
MLLILHSVLDLALPEQREALALDAINKRGETLGEDTYGEVHSFCTNLHKTGVRTISLLGST